MSKPKELWVGKPKRPIGMRYWQSLVAESYEALCERGATVKSAVRFIEYSAYEELETEVRMLRLKLNLGAKVFQEVVTQLENAEGEK